MDNSGYSKWDSSSEEVPRGHRGCWESWGHKSVLVALALVVAAVLWALVLSILLSKASTEREVLLDHQDLLWTNGSEAKAQLQTTRDQLGEAQKKLLEQESALNELRQTVTKDVAQASRDRENIRNELLRALEAAKLGNNSCEPCPRPWKSFKGSCYLFSEQRATWQQSQKNCAVLSAHLVIVDDLEEQTFLSQNTAGRGLWLGLRAVRRERKVLHYQWVDGLQLTFSQWNQGEPNDSRGMEDCVMMLHNGLWNDAPCNNERDNWICERRRSC